MPSSDTAVARDSPSGRLDRAWRVVGTGLAFALFGIGAMLQGFTLWPLLRLTAPNRRVGIARVQRSVSRSMRAFAWFMQTFRIISYEVRDREQLAQRGRFFVANHPTLIDVVLLMGYMPEVDCVVKQELWHNVFLRWPVVWAGYISNATGEGLVAACAAALREGRSLIVFPEGTRTRPGEAMSLQRGAAQIALAAVTDLTPVAITCDPVSLYKGTPWYRVPVRRSHWVISVGAPIQIRPFVAADEPQPLAARHLTQALAQWFETNVARQLEEMRHATRARS